MILKISELNDNFFNKAFQVPADYLPDKGIRYKENKTLLVIDFVADLRRIKAVQRQRDEYFEDGKEFMELETGFKLNFSNDFTDNFLTLVSDEIEAIL